ncbi:flippase [Halococcus agarilyticus]|uniref:flippase n=1 Tax=Halococcus agarilyticus TaxID=1232219 RepID=UPI0006780DB5|nr:flippase [Halococcus agarilyticus]
MAVDDDREASAESNLSRIASSASLMLFVGSLGSFSKLIERVIIGNTLGQEALGAVSIGISLMTLGKTVALVGFDQGVPRFMSRFDDDRDVRGAWLTGLLVAGIGGIAISAILLFYGDWVADVLLNESGDIPQALLVAFVCSIPLVAVQQIAIRAIQGFENTIYRVYVQDLLYNGFRIVLLVVLLLAGVGVIAAGYAYFVLAALSVVAGFYFLDRLLPIRGEFRLHTRPMLSFSLPLVISSVVTVVLSQIDTLMLAAFTPTGAVGIYNAAYPIAAGVPVLLSSFGFIYLPLISRLDSEGEHDEIERIHKLITKWIYTLGFPVVLTVVFFATDVVSFVFNEDFAAAGPALAILALGFYTSGAVGNCQDALSAFGYTRLILGINVTAAVANVVLNVVLIRGLGPIPGYGVTGAALASALSFAALNVLAFAALWYTRSITPFSRWNVRAYFVLPLVLVPPTALLTRAVTLGPIGLAVFGLAAALSTVAVVAVSGGLQSEDIVPVEGVENRLGVEIPLIRRFIPDDDDRHEILRDSDL